MYMENYISMKSWNHQNFKQCKICNS